MNADMKAYVNMAVLDARRQWERALLADRQSPALTTMITLAGVLTFVAMSWKSTALTNTIKYVLSIAAASVAFFVLFCRK